jgi:hypothetical protein
VPEMGPMQLRLLDEIRGDYPRCPACGTRTVPNPIYMRNIRGDVRVALLCPNRDKPHPEGYEVAETFLNPTEVRTLRL